MPDDFSHQRESAGIQWINQTTVSAKCGIQNSIRTTIMIYIKILLNCDWLISMQLISNSSAEFCNNSAKICNKTDLIGGKTMGSTNQTKHGGCT
jgi:hypothetical protein